MNQTDDLAALTQANATLDTVTTEVTALQGEVTTLEGELANQTNTPEVDAAFAALSQRVNALATQLTPPPPPAPPAGS
jgi:hypothetical protein